ncbi:hypothetical protein EDB81DRAFT_766566 [Dactylonectria macrodidyma]|uniref:Uncharacterized protein n=1 Tax=Dactylonectria macrodidyma TaxID=307937 RepID=A0A9P9DL06_9HYPO|nr:hypothetical protein EDB81DRAFT_766566 [Dactylonectria macrodidyma]
MASFTQWIWSLSFRLIPTTLLLDSASNVEVDWKKEKEKRRLRFEDLPLQKDDPAWSAWGLWGADDELSTLNLLTEETIREVSKEIKEGISIPLNLPIEAPLLPMNPARKRCNHNILSKGYANDDELDFNTQSSSHWAGLRHYPYQNYDVPRYYNHAVQDDFTGPTASSRIGIQYDTTFPIHNIFLPIQTWQGVESLAAVSYSICGLTRCAKASSIRHLRHTPSRCTSFSKWPSNSTFQRGDILLTRSGWTEEYVLLSDEQKVALAQRKQRAFVGVEGSKDMIKWHWDNGFAAVAGDTNAYQAWPPTREDGVCCHEVFLSGWGMPIGEVWDLEALTRTCKRLGRWTFFLTSSHLNLENGVASPSNAIPTF